MAHPVTDALGLVLGHFNDVIEGGNAYAAGNSYTGIPGLFSNDSDIRVGAAITATTAASTTTITDNNAAWKGSKWNSARSPNFYAKCTSGSGRNLNQVRKIESWNPTTKVFTTAAWPVNVVATDTFDILEGFKAFPDGMDFNSNTDTEEGDSAGFDRFYSIEASDEGFDRAIRGAGRATRQVDLTIRVRILTYQRDRRARQSAFANMAVLREGLMHHTNRTGSLIRCVLGGGASTIEVHDTSKIIVAMTLPVIYSVATGIL